MHDKKKQAKAVLMEHVPMDDELSNQVEIDHNQMNMLMEETNAGLDNFVSVSQEHVLMDDELPNLVELDQKLILSQEQGLVEDHVGQFYDELHHNQME